LVKTTIRIIIGFEKLLKVHSAIDLSGFSDQPVAKSSRLDEINMPPRCSSGAGARVDG
jgi:hypothetical protein